MIVVFPYVPCMLCFSSRASVAPLCSQVVRYDKLLWRSREASFAGVGIRAASVSVDSDRSFMCALWLALSRNITEVECIGRSYPDLQ